MQRLSFIDTQNSELRAEKNSRSSVLLVKTP
jgi:hypothetical protein